MNEKIIDLLKKQLITTPDDWDIILPLAQQYAENGNITDATEALSSSSVEIKDDLLATLLAEVEKQKESTPHYTLCLLDRLLLDNKALATAYMTKSDIYHELGNQKLALKNYNVAIVIDESLEDDTREAELEESSKEADISPKTDQSPSSKQPRERIAQASSNSAIPSLSNAGIPEREMLDDDDEFSDEDFAETDRLLESLTDGLPMINFSDLGGMDELKDRIRMSIIHPFKNKALFAKFKKKTGGGILMYGPPGCGKTLVSRATAGECGAHFMNISIHEILSKWIGEAEQRVHELFETARRKSPSIIFIDEIDALCVKRSDAGNSASLVNTLLNEIDGAAHHNEDVLVIGATNTPWRIDSAFRRPGRFDHVLFVPPPDALARVSVFELALKDIPQEKINLGKLAKISEKFSGADIVACVQAASEQVISQIISTGKESNLTEKALLQAVKKHRATTLEWLEQATNYASFANQSGLYDDLAEYLRLH